MYHMHFNILHVYIIKTLPESNSLSTVLAAHIVAYAVKYYNNRHWQTQCYKYLWCSMIPITCSWVDPSSGTAQDYSKETAGVKYTFTAELRGNSFIVPADQIQPSFEEVWNGVTAAIATIDPWDGHVMAPPRGQHFRFSCEIVVDIAIVIIIGLRM